MQTQIAARGHFSAGASGKTDNRQRFLSACADRSQDVWRTSRSRDRTQRISGPAETENLPLEPSFISVIVADRGKYRGIGRQRDGRGGGTVIIEARQHLSGYVLRVGGAAAVAGQKELASVAQSICDDLGDIVYRAAENRIVDCRLNNIARLGQIVENRVLCHTRHPFYPHQLAGQR